MENKRGFVRPDRLPLVRRIAGPLHNPRRDFTRLPPLPPRNRAVYGSKGRDDAKGRNGVRRPLAELFVRNSQPKDDDPNPKGIPGGLLTLTRRSHQISSAAAADSYIVEIPPPPSFLEKSAPEVEDELGMVIASIRPRYPEVAPRGGGGHVLHTTVADELGLMAAMAAAKRKATIGP
ncbi:hypothetical protein FBU31_003147 [Coemansia sp. 'formosensis']|nr:hypothetical protein FBU31_003147 [Coemansia sp. 'formosensis']